MCCIFCNWSPSELQLVGNFINCLQFVYSEFLHTENFFLNFVISTRNQIVFNIFRLIWIQINREMVNTI